MINRPLFLLLIVSTASLCLLTGMPLASAATSSIVWAETQAHYEDTHALPDDAAWVEYPLLRSGDSTGTTRVTFSVVDQTINNGNKAGQYELLGTNPIVFGPGETYALIRVRYHPANHDLFGPQHLTFRLSGSDADIEPDQETRTVYVDYPAAPAMAFAAPPAGGYRGVEGQGPAVVLNITKEGDVMVDAYADIFASGTANNGPDYAAADASGLPVGIPGTIRLPPGQSVYSIFVTLLNDEDDEGNETATLTLGNVRGAVPGNLTDVSVIICEAGTVTSVTPMVTPAATPSTRPTPTQAATTVAPTGNSTPVPLPGPGFGPEAALVAIVGIVFCLKALKNRP